MQPTESEEHPRGAHRSARERQRKGPMWGCLKALFWIFTVSLLALIIIVGGGWWYVGTSSFAGLVQARIQSTLEAKLGRAVYIHDVVLVRSRPTRVIINDLRIANAPNGKAKYFATVRQVEITGGVESFWGRTIKVGRIDVRDPRLFFEVYPDGNHNFPHWESGKQGRFDIYHLELGQMLVTGGAFGFDDLKHNIGMVAENLASDIKITSAQGIYEGLATSPHVHVRIQDYEPFDLDMRGGFRYTPGVLQLNSVALKGNGIEAFLTGKLDPLTEGVYALKLNSRIELARIADIFRVQKTLQGAIALDGNLRGKQGNFVLSGGWVAPKISADVYDLTNLRGRMNVTGEKTQLEVDTARYGGGSLSAHYSLPGYSEPYPMSIDLRFNGVSLEKLFGDWGVKDTGLRGGATGTLAYKWNKDLVLAGSGNGTATLAKNATAFGNAKYPIPIGGSTDFALNNGVIRFNRGELVTDASAIGFTGTMRIEDLNSNLALKIHSSDFSELDRAAYNFAHSAGKTTYTLLGLGGAGDISGTVVGRLKTPAVVAHIASTGTKYNNILLGDADIDLRYDGAKSVLAFNKAVFHDGAARLAMTGTIAFPDRGPSPQFDLAVDAVGYPVDRALELVDLKTLKLKGLGTGRMVITGTPESGRVTFADMTVRQGSAYVKVNGTTNWAPGKGNIAFNLDVAANDFPVEDIAAFLDFANLPLKGKLTGTLHLEGTKSSLEGAGAVTVRNGSIMGEPVTEARADITFTKGTLKATHVAVTAPAGTLTGEAEVDLNTNRFSYNIASSSIDLSKIGLLSSLQSLFGGKLVFTSSGGGTLDQPELVIEAKLNEATLQGLNLPPNAAPPSIYLAIRNGQLIIRGSVADVVTIEGNGTVGGGNAVDGTVRLTIADIARALALSPATASLPASGNAIIDLKLSGKLSPFEALVVDGSVPTLNLRVSEHEFTAPRPLRFSLRNGRATFDDFTLARQDSSFTVSGYADLTGDKRLDVGLKGNIEAALLQLFVKDLRADGHINVIAGVSGTLANPRITGTAELQDAQFKFAGFPQLIDHVTGTLVFKGDRIEIDSLRATLGGGQVVAGGFITVNGLMPERVRLSLQGTDVALRYYEGLTVEGTFNILVNGDLERMTVTGDVDVTRALYFKDFDFQASLVNVLLSRRGVQPVVSASWQDRVDLRLHVVAPGTLAVRNNIADVTGSAELDVTGTLSNPVVLGLITLEEGGRVRIQNVDYHVVRGSINFQNPFRIDPYFDITIEGRVSSTGAGGLSAEVESGPVDVTINLTGTIDRFTPSITSDPPASDITLFSLLGFGGFTQGSERYGQASPNAALAGRSILYQSLFSALGSKILPFADSFTYDPGLLDTTGDQRPKVTFEKRLSTKLSLLVVYSISDGKTRQVLEWAINPEWTMQAMRDEIRTREFRLEARFRRRDPGQWKNPFAMFAGLRPTEAGPNVGPALQPAPGSGWGEREPKRPPGGA
ncbi:MAG TPA: translocation/assembly module TamB domain-containing protein, partial [Thermoanaerobaculia bacterium]|nr:translocation/assembly module TamB domain-containing protein [Thermoanaerobaculia bacterium]